MHNIFQSDTITTLQWLIYLSDPQDTFCLRVKTRSWHISSDNYRSAKIFSHLRSASSSTILSTNITSLRRLLMFCGTGEFIYLTWKNIDMMGILPSPIFEPTIFTANLSRPRMLAHVRIRYKNRPLAITWHFVAVQNFARGRPFSLEKYLLTKGQNMSLVSKIWNKLRDQINYRDF